MVHMKIRVNLRLLTRFEAHFYGAFQFNKQLKVTEPGTANSAKPAIGCFFTFLRPDSPSNSVRFYGQDPLYVPVTKSA